jgi:hypothetical protein
MKFVRYSFVCGVGVWDLIVLGASFVSNKDALRTKRKSFNAISIYNSK